MAGEKQEKLRLRERRRELKRRKREQTGDTPEKRRDRPETDVREQPAPGRLLDYSAWTPGGDLAKGRDGL